MSARQVQKELQRQTVLFEEACRGGASFSAVKFGVFLEQWFTEYAAMKLKRQTITSYKWLTKRVVAELGHLRLDKITPRNIQRFVAKLADTDCAGNHVGKLSSKTIRDYVSLVSGVFEYARKMQLVARNPCEDVTLPRNDKKERAMLTLDEAQRLLVLLGQECDENRQLALFITLAIYTGCRRGELLGLEWRDLDLENGLLSIKRAAYYSKERGAYTDTPKTKSSLRTLKVSEDVTSLMKRYREWQECYATSLCDKWQDNGRVFTNWCGAPMYTNAPERYFKRICELNGLPRVSLHSLRHLNASLLISAGLDVKTVQSSLGHSSAATTLDIYAHEFSTAQALASAAVSNALERKISE
jgi:integrase